MKNVWLIKNIQEHCVELEVAESDQRRGGNPYEVHTFFLGIGRGFGILGWLIGWHVPRCASLSPSDRQTNHDRVCLRVYHRLVLLPIQSERVLHSASYRYRNYRIFFRIQGTMQSDWLTKQMFKIIQLGTRHCLCEFKNILNVKQASCWFNAGRRPDTAIDKSRKYQDIAVNNQADIQRSNHIFKVMQVEN